MVEVKKEVVCFRKAEREKLRRDKLKEQFLELGNALGIYLSHKMNTDFELRLMVSCCRSK